MEGRLPLKSLWLAVCFTLLPSFSLAGECLHLAMPGGDRIVRDAAAYAMQMFYRFGVCVNISVVPPRRATNMMLAGELDGEIARTADYAEAVGQVADKVPTPVMIQKACMVTSNDRAQSLKDIDRPDFTIGIVRGWYWMNKIAKQFQNANVRVVEEQSTLIEMFKKGRLDAILMGTDVVKFHQMDTRFNVIHIGEFPAHVWLHKNKSYMLGHIDDAIMTFTQDMGANAVEEAFGEFRAK